MGNFNANMSYNWNKFSRESAKRAYTPKSSAAGKDFSQPSSADKGFMKELVTKYGPSVKNPPRLGPVERMIGYEPTPAGKERAGNDFTTFTPQQKAKAAKNAAFDKAIEAQKAERRASGDTRSADERQADSFSKSAARAMGKENDRHNPSYPQPLQAEDKYWAAESAKNVVATPKVGTPGRESVYDKQSAATKAKWAMQDRADSQAITKKNGGMSGRGRPASGGGEGPGDKPGHPFRGNQYT